MAFASLLEHVGGMGRFQVASVLLLALPVLMMASHNLLQNFTAATSDHRCRLRWEANATGLDLQDLLRVSVPRGERCRRFVTPPVVAFGGQRLGSQQQLAGDRALPRRLDLRPQRLHQHHHH